MTLLVSRLEIGAGGGLVGLAVAKGCLVNESHPLYLTDQLEMFSLMEHNIVLNDVVGRVKASVLDWFVLFYLPLTSPIPTNTQPAREYAATRNLVYWGTLRPCNITFPA